MQLNIFGVLTLALTASALPGTKVVPRENTEEAARIIGGSVVSSGDFKSTAYLEMYDGGRTRNRCTGSLIAPNVVLTAGHCTYKDEITQYQASDFQVGITHTISTSPSVLFKGHSVARVIRHPKFSMMDLVDDIALLILADSVPESEGTPIQIYSGKYSKSTPIRAAGFGLTDPNDPTSVSPQLMEVDLAIGSNSLCAQNSDTYSSRTQICTDGTAGKDTCQGDSGGPLVTPVDNGSQKTALLGLTSYGTVSSSNPEGLCAVRGSSGFYTYIAPYIDWISSEADLNAKDIQITNTTSSANNDDEEEDSNTTSRSSGNDDFPDFTLTGTDADDSIDFGDFASSLSNAISNIFNEDGPTTSGASRAQLAVAAVGVAAMLF
ncbi:Serine protease 55 [Coemansia sp. RSA 2336]|nr:Serine protease 55 [Coemansia sp. RSA 2336]